MPVVVEGYKELIQKLNAFEPDLNKQMKIEIKAAMLPIRDKARGYAPSPFPSNLYNWADKGRSSEFNNNGGRKFPTYNPAEVIKGINYRAGGNKKSRYGFSALYSVVNTSAAGAIYETAGRVNPQGRPTSHTIIVDKRFTRRKVTVKTTKDSQSRNPKAGAMFINSMGPMTGQGNQRGRLIFRAWNESQGKAQDAVIHAIEKAARRFNERNTQSNFILAA